MASTDTTTIDTFIRNLAAPSECLVCGAPSARSLSVRATRVRFTLIFYTSYEQARVPVQYCREHWRRAMRNHVLGVVALLAVLAAAVLGTIRLFMDDQLLAGTAALILLVPATRWLDRHIQRLTQPAAIRLRKNGAAAITFASPDIAARWRSRGRF